MISPLARDGFIRQITQAKTAQERDASLELFADCLYRATEWDADQWGFNPDTWMEQERFDIALLGGVDWPKDIVDW